VDREDQRVVAKEREREIEPEVPRLQMQHVWSEFPDVPSELRDHPSLTKRLPQPWKPKSAECDLRVDVRRIGGGRGFRDQEQDRRSAGQPIGQSDRILDKVEVQKGDSHTNP
jgi:hypothetical protein